MPDAHYDNPALAEIYDLNSGWSKDRDFYLALAEPAPQNILDLGCGTGLICNEYAARGHQITGVDPSPAMLHVADQKPLAKTIEWVLATAQDFQSDKLFDLIIMTGHSFQALLSEGDVAQTCETLRKHLAPNGLVVFETRNPAIDWQKRWNYSGTHKMHGRSVHVARKFISMDENRMTFELRYEFPHETLLSKSVIGFHSRTTIEKQLSGANLRVERLLGDWSGQSFNKNTSEEMIFLVRHF